MSKNNADLVSFATSKAATETYLPPAGRLVRGRLLQHNTLHFQADERCFAGEWEVVETTHKIYVVYAAPVQA